jgi:hypothetical protein
MTKKTAVLTENVVRRWGKLANMKTLTENFIDQLAEEEEEMEVELSADDAEVEVEDEMEMDMGGEAEVEAEVSLSEPEVAMIVQGIADKLGELTGAQIEVETSEEADLEADAEDDMMDAADDMMDAEDDLEDAAAMRDPYNRTDETMDNKKGGEGYNDEEDEELEKDGTERTKKQTFRDRRDEKRAEKKAANRKDETLNIELVDEEQITEAVLARVIERLIKNNK